VPLTRVEASKRLPAARIKSRATQYPDRDTRAGHPLTRSQIQRQLAQMARHCFANLTPFILGGHIGNHKVFRIVTHDLEYPTAQPAHSEVTPDEDRLRQISPKQDEGGNRATTPATRTIGGL